jgi:hypothetical protein
MAAKITRIRLQADQKFALAMLVSERREAIATGSVTRSEFARQASQELGYAVTGSNVAYAAQQARVEWPRFRPSPIQPAPVENATLPAEVATLKGEVAELRSEIINILKQIKDLAAEVDRKNGLFAK